jgi:site-specific recombinase XerD
MDVQKPCSRSLVPPWLERSDTSRIMEYRLKHPCLQFRPEAVQIWAAKIISHLELVAIRLDEVDVECCQIRITQGKGSKDRQVPFPLSFRELLALHTERMRDKGAVFLFESVRKHKYTDRCVRKMLARYATQAGITRSMSPHKWRHFLFTWLKKEALMMPSSNLLRARHAPVVGDLLQAFPS